MLSSECVVRERPLALMEPKHVQESARQVGLLEGQKRDTAIVARLEVRKQKEKEGR